MRSFRRKKWITCELDLDGEPVVVEMRATMLKLSEVEELIAAAEDMRSDDADEDSPGDPTDWIAIAELSLDILARNVSEVIAADEARADYPRLPDERAQWWADTFDAADIAKLSAAVQSGGQATEKKLG